VAKRRKQMKKVKYYSPKRRAVYAQGDDINPFVLFQLHGWICCVCKDPIDKKLRLPNYMAATVEHVIPLCQGGTHTWDNVGPAPARCNFDKADKFMPELLTAS
jgi:5-methylcytosine-specific restriction endonuclease McrA